jgi:hypothetical protein
MHELTIMCVQMYVSAEMAKTKPGNFSPGNWVHLGFNLLIAILKFNTLHRYYIHSCIYWLPFWHQQLGLVQITISPSLECKKLDC